MVTREEKAPSPRQPLSRQGVLRISGHRRTTSITNKNAHGLRKADFKMRIGAINVATLKGKEEELVEVMKMRDLSILALAETRLKGKGDRIIHENYRLIYSGREDSRHGVGFLVAANLAPYVEKVNNINERIMSIDMTLETGISIIQVYAPQQGRTTAEKEEFYRLLQEGMDDAKYQSNIILCGDWNGHIGQEREGFEGNVGTFGIGEKNVEGERILDFAKINNLSIMNTYYKHRKSQKWTWYRYSKQTQSYTQMSMIDLFLTNNKALFLDVKTIPSVSMDADHRLVIAKVRIKKPKSTRKIGIKRYNLAKLSETEHVEKMRKAIEEKYQQNDEDDIDAELLWNKFKEKITEAADEVLGEKKPYQGKKKMTPWWSEEVREAVKLKMRTFRIWMKTRSVVDRLHYVEARNGAERVKRKAKQDCWNQIGIDLEEDLNGTKKLLYSLAKRYRGKKNEGAYAIKDKSGNLLTQLGDIGKRWREYFSELLNLDSDLEGAGEAVLRNLDIIVGPENLITLEEVKNAVKKMKKGKSPGGDGLPVEIIRAGGECVLNKLLNIFNTAYITENVPSDWQKGVISPLFKKGEKTSCHNYRGITLLSHVGKIYTRILEKRLRACVEGILNDSQYGFRPGRGTTDAVFVVKMILEKSWEWGADKYALFIDLEKAFDRVDRENLWQVLRDPHYNIPTKLLRVIKSIYAESKSKVTTQGIESDWFDIKSGVRQGDVLSPLLFIIFMDKCLRDIRTGINNEETVMYADDVVVFADTVDDIRNVANRWSLGMKANGMKVNTKKGKTEFLVVSRSSQQHDIYMNQNKINQTESYCHLGVNVGESNVQEVEINNRIAKYNSNIGMLYPLLKDKNIPRECKVIVYKSILKPILLYGSENWSLTTKTESKLQAAEMRMLRLIKGVTRRDRIRNVNIREELQIRPLLEEIERNKLRWFGHVKRMDTEKKPRKFLEWRPTGKRPTGRPRRRWIEGVEAALKRRGTSLREIEENKIYERREDWRCLVKSSLADR